MKTTLAARRLVGAEGMIDWPRITVDGGGGITKIEAAEPSEPAASTTLTPAFFDIHIHGAAGHDVMEGTSEGFARVGRFLATKGVAHYLATTVTAPVDATLHALDGIAIAIDSTRDAVRAHPVGIHLEGPFISHAKRGVHPAAEIQPPSVALFERMQQAARGHIRLMTIAPEMSGALELIEYATKVGTYVSVGHSDATAAQSRAAIAAGARSATHTFNAMRTLDHREPGIAGVVLDAEELYAELICDGIHVAPEVVRLWLRAKTGERAILVTDGISATGMPDGNYKLGEFEVMVNSGRCLLASDLARGIETLAGSVLTMDRAVANLRRITGASLATAVHAASRNPARMLGMEALGTIAVGQPANFNVYSADGVLLRTLIRGVAVS